MQETPTAADPGPPARSRGRGCFPLIINLLLLLFLAGAAAAVWFYVNKSGIPFVKDGYSRFGGARINPELTSALNEWAAKVDPDDLDLLKRRAAQGVGDAPRSKGTHLDGWALDFGTYGLEDDEVRRMVNALNIGDSRYFAAVLRLPGEAGPFEHIHAAFRGRSNYDRIKPLIGPGGPNHIERKLKKRNEKD